MIYRPRLNPTIGRARVLSPLFLFFFGLAVISARKKKRQRFPTTEAQVIYFKPSGLMKRKWRQWKGRRGKIPGGITTTDTKKKKNPCSPFPIKLPGCGGEKRKLRSSPSPSKISSFALGRHFTDSLVSLLPVRRAKEEVVFNPVSEEEETAALYHHPIIAVTGRRSLFFQMCYFGHLFCVPYSHTFILETDPSFALPPSEPPISFEPPPDRMCCNKEYSFFVSLQREKERETVPNTNHF